jgi:hypothetical protein
VRDHCSSSHQQLEVFLLLKERYSPRNTARSQFAPIPCHSASGDACWLSPCIWLLLLQEHIHVYMEEKAARSKYM